MTEIRWTGAEGSDAKSACENGYALSADQQGCWSVWHDGSHVDDCARGPQYTHPKSLGSAQAKAVAAMRKHAKEAK